MLEPTGIPGKIIPAGNEWTAAEHIQEGERQSRYRFTLGLDNLGRCSQCRHLQCTATKYGRVFALCRAWMSPISSVDPPIECTIFENRHEMPLHIMAQIAIPIEAEKPRQAGFESDL